MKVVWKKTLLKTDVSHIELPEDALIIHVDYQGGQGEVLTFWFECERKAPLGFRRVLVVGTGWDVCGGYRGIGPWQHRGSTIADDRVWHLYEEVKQS